MSAQDRSRADQIRALIEEADRVRNESERMRNQLDRSMKRPFWPERRRTARVPPPPDAPDGNNDAA